MMFLDAHDPGLSWSIVTSHYEQVEDTDD
jgi:hypothetical protein